MLLDDSGLFAALPILVARCVAWRTVLGLAATALSLFVAPFARWFGWIAVLTARAAFRAGVQILRPARQGGETSRG